MEGRERGYKIWTNLFTKSIRPSKFSLLNSDITRSIKRTEEGGKEEEEEEEKEEKGTDGEVNFVSLIKEKNPT